ncbi:MAG: Ig-like domain-containing protein [Clostridia bacterium]|nr:Ig-like domain-containing protein [Clostridia bacterium]
MKAFFCFQKRQRRICLPKAALCFFLAALFVLGAVPCDLHLSVSAVSNPASDTARLIVDKHFRYLQEIYVEKYPETALVMTHGTEKDHRILKALADTITEGCQSDEEKAVAIVGWICRNLKSENTSHQFYAIDTFYARRANCAGYAYLLRDLLRLSGIPAVWGDGLRGDMTDVSLYQVTTSLPGHAWCFAYLDGEWKLFDPLWEQTTGLTDRDYISRYYYMETVEMVVPAYEKILSYPFRSSTTMQYYEDTVWSYQSKTVDSTVGSVGICVNGVAYFDFHVRIQIGSSQDGGRYVENPERRQNMKPGEVYRDGWYFYGGLYYAYPNGVTANETVKTFEGKKYYLDRSGAVELIVSEEDCSFRLSQIYLDRNYRGRVVLPYEYELHAQNSANTVLWESSDPSIATVDQNGFVTACGKEGKTTLSVSITDGDRMIVCSMEIDLYFWEDTRVPDYSDVKDHVCNFNIPHEVEATCLTDGYMEYFCECGLKEKGAVTQEALGHLWGEWIVIKEASATEPGLRRATCSRCGVPKEEIIVHQCRLELKEEKKPDCTEGGYQIYICYGCMKEYPSEESDPLGHAYGFWVTVKEPTETEEGLQEKTCSRCGDRLTQSVPCLPPGHQCRYLPTKTIPPTCLEGGYTEYTCSCGGSYEADATAPLGHSFGAWTVILEPTPKYEGTEERICSRCSQRESRPIPKTEEHRCVFEIVKIYEPDCINFGYHTLACRECGAKMDEIAQDAPPLGHSYGPWKVLEYPTATSAGAKIHSCIRCPVEEILPIAVGESTEGMEPFLPDLPVPPEENPTDPSVPSQPSNPTDPSVPSQPSNPQGPALSEGSLSHQGSGITLWFPSEEASHYQNARLVVESPSPETEKAIGTLLKDLFDEEFQLEVLDISLVSGQNAIQPSGIIAVTVPLPAGWGEDVALFYVNPEEGYAEPLDWGIHEDGGFLVFETDHFSYYVLAREQKEGNSPEEPEPLPGEVENDPFAPLASESPWLLPVLCGGGVALLVLVAVVFLLLGKKSKV